MSKALFNICRWIIDVSLVPGDLLQLPYSMVQSFKVRKPSARRTKLWATTVVMLKLGTLAAIGGGPDEGVSQSPSAFTWSYLGSPESVAEPLGIHVSLLMESQP